MSKLVTAVFLQQSHAENAARQIKEEGLKTDDISIVARDNSQDKNSGPLMKENKGVKDNISDGVVAGGIIGGLAGLLIGAGTLAVPGFGIVAAAGPVAGLISGTAAGGIAGGLIDLGIPEDMGRHYENEIKKGKILFSMKTENQNVDRVSNILRHNGAEKVEEY